MADMTPAPSSALPSSRAPATVFVIGSLVVACSARVGRCPEPGESIAATGFIMEAGGKGFNVALAAHRLGVPVDGVFAVGDDAPGGFMRAAFAAQGLDAGLIHMVPAAATGAGVGLIQDDGENRIAVYPGANASLSADHVRARADGVRGARLIFAQFEAPDSAIAEAFAMGRASGVTTMLNPSPYRPIHPDILGATDILIVNEQEAAALVREGHGAHDALAVSLGVETLIVTRGKDGAVAWQDGQRLEQPAFSVEAVDSIGAGDAFAGGVIAALVAGQPLATGLRWGCGAGALAVSKLGLATALPDKTELDDMLVNHIGTV